MSGDVNDPYRRLAALLERAHRTGLGPEAANLVRTLPADQQSAWTGAFELIYRSGGDHLDLHDFSTWADAYDATDSNPARTP
jgi:hypothetical protein